jgi:hypothetical protein
MKSFEMVWHIEYTNHPSVPGKRRKALEKLLAEAIGKVESLLQAKGDGSLTLDSDFQVESVWIKEIRKHHVALCSLKGGGEWVATIVFENYPTMTLKEVKATLKAMGFSEYSLYALGVDNEETVGELLNKMEADLMEETEECVKQIRLVNKAFLEAFLEKGIIKLSDGLLDAFKKIEATYARE